MGGMPGSAAARALPKVKPREAATGAVGWEVPMVWDGHRFGARWFEVEVTGVEEIWRPGWMLRTRFGFARSAPNHRVLAGSQNIQQPFEVLQGTLNTSNRVE